MAQTVANYSLRHHWWPNIVSRAPACPLSIHERAWTLSSPLRALTAVVPSKECEQAHNDTTLNRAMATSMHTVSKEPTLTAPGRAYHRLCSPSYTLGIPLVFCALLRVSLILRFTLIQE